MWLYDDGNEEGDEERSKGSAESLDEGCLKVCALWEVGTRKPFQVQ